MSSTRAKIAAAAASLSVLAVGWQLGNSAHADQTADSTATDATTGSGPTGSPVPGGVPSAELSPSAATSATPGGVTPGSAQSVKVSIPPSSAAPSSPSPSPSAAKSATKPATSAAPAPKPAPEPPATKPAPQPPAPPAPPPPPAPPAPPQPRRHTTMRDGRFSGAWTDYKYGKVSVNIQVSGGRVIDVGLETQAPDPQSFTINRQAHVVLGQRFLQSGTSNVGTASGATYTSAAYRTSLQNALDQAYTY